MPRGDGRGPTGDGPLTGRGSGVCILRSGGEDGDRITGFAGVDGKRVEVTTNNASAYAKAGNKEVSQMPGGDGTGPTGAGPMTGRAAGYCAGSAAPGYAMPGLGRGRGRGARLARRVWRGLGLGYRGGHAWAGDPPRGGTQPAEQELDVLKGQAEYFTGALDDIKKRIGELEAATKTELP